MTNEEENTMEILTKEEILEHVNGGLFPTGEFVSGVCCPRCGDRDNLIKGESFQASYLTPSIEKIVTDKTVTVYSCPICGMKFMTYGPFYETI